jgi:hypothetical protein
MVIAGFNIMHISFSEMLFLSFVALFVVVPLSKFCYFYRRLFRLLNTQPEEKMKLSSANKNKYGLIFSKDWFENEELEYYRVQTRESLRSAIGFAVAFSVAFLIFAYSGAK